MIIGLTGNYGMGKSFVLHAFKELGAIVLDSDEIVDLLLQEKKVILEVKKILGPSVVREDGTLDKAEIAKKIFDSSPCPVGIQNIQIADFFPLQFFPGIRMVHEFIFGDRFMHMP